MRGTKSEDTNQGASSALCVFLKVLYLPRIFGYLNIFPYVLNEGKSV